MNHLTNINDIEQSISNHRFCLFYIKSPDANIAYANWNEGNKKKGEVDIVGISEARQKPEWAVEVKWSNKLFMNPSAELKSLETFMKTNGLTHAIFNSISETGKKERRCFFMSDTNIFLSFFYGIFEYLP